ncbi:thiamine diphosphokinase [Marinilactibacillus kalidii]|uniref:thiamine diphosphokinase n=1 Tax=Marinilactibacillus kalidii TaxID=2820274 RepID=UPI001ABDC560|nr:thiamine diphosphokinase [Marinilactibacillus kalidii]
MSIVHIMLGSPDEQRVWPPQRHSDYYIGVDRGAFYLTEKGYKPDLVLGDFDSISQSEKIDIKQQAKEFMQFDPDKDDTDAELSLVYAMQRFNPEKIIFYGWSGGRLDHFMSILMIALQPRFKEIVPMLELVDQTNSVRYFLPGSYVIHKETDKKYCSVIGMTPVKRLTLDEGFKYTLSSVDYDYAIALISNEFEKENAQLTFESGIVAFIQSRDKA